MLYAFLVGMLVTGGFFSVLEEFFDADNPVLSQPEDKTVRKIAILIVFFFWWVVLFMRCWIHLHRNIRRRKLGIT